MRTFVVLSVVLTVMGSAIGAEAGTPTIAINEVMANPLDEDTGEFVELYNWGDAPIDLLGWRLADSADTNDVIQDYSGLHDWGRPGTKIPAGGYALIVDPEYAGEYNPFLRAHADSALVILLTIGLDTTIGNGLTNSGDLVLISDGSGFWAVFSWSADSGGGISWEKIEPQLGDGGENWTTSVHSHGSTPGARNSVSRALADVSILGEELFCSPRYPQPGQMVEIGATVRNQGKTPASEVQVIFFQDLDGDTLLDEGEQIGAPHVLAQPLLPDSNSVFRQSWLPPGSGSHLVAVWAAYPPDEDPADNWAVFAIQVRFALWTVVINEIMSDPAPTGEDSGKEPEWLEILHLGASSLDLAHWTIEDSRGQPHGLCDSVVILDPGGYAVIAAGQGDDFQRAHPVVRCPVLFPQGGLPSLNNAEDLVLLRDPTGSTVDSVLYRGDWGGGGGISLERINPHLGSNDPLNWSWCVYPSGASPGEQNSIFTPLVPAKISLWASPNPFSPDGDGHQEVTIITYRLPSAAARMTLLLFDIRGRRVRTLVDQERCASSGEAIWDGRSDSGELLKMGLYVIYLEALDGHRGVVCRERKTVVLAGRLD